MNMLTVLGISLALQCGHCLKLVDQSSVQLMGQLADQSWPSVSALIEDVDFELNQQILEASEGHGVAVGNAVADEHAKQTMANTLLQMRSTNFEEALGSQSEFQAMPAAQQHQYYKGIGNLQRLSESPALEHFMTEGVPKLTTSVKQDASFMAFLKDAAEKLPQPADQSSEAGAPLLKELGSIAPRIAKYLMPRMQGLLKSDSHVAFLQDPKDEVSKSQAVALDSGFSSLVDEKKGKVKFNEWMERMGFGGKKDESAEYASIVPVSSKYWRTQTGFNTPIPLNPSCTGVCLYLDIGMVFVKLLPLFANKKAVRGAGGPCFIIIRPGLMFRMPWGFMHVAAYFPTKGTKSHNFGPLNIQKYGWEVGYTYEGSSTLPPDDNTMQKYGGWVIGTGLAQKNYRKPSCPTRIPGNLDAFNFVEPMAGFKVSFRGKMTMWLPMVRTGRSAEDTGHQTFALFQPFTLKIGQTLEYPKFIGIAVGQLRNWIIPKSQAGNQCEKETGEQTGQALQKQDAKHQVEHMKTRAQREEELEGENVPNDMSRNAAAKIHKQQQTV